MLSFIGGSYSLTTRKADVQRAVNLFPTLIESGSGKTAAYLQSIPGLTEFADLSAEIRCMYEQNEHLFVVAGDTLYEITQFANVIVRGTLLTTTGPVDAARGLTQLVLVDGANGYVYDLSTTGFAQIADPDFNGADRVAYDNGLFVFNHPLTQQFYISAIEDATTYDALDFASSEGSPDGLISLVFNRGELWLFGSDSVEVWYRTDNPDFPFSRNMAAAIEIGCCSAHAPRKLANEIYWVSSDARGAGVVWRTNGYTPERISTQAIEQQLAGADLTTVVTYAYHMHGRAFFAINADGLETTLVYDAASQTWHERAELVAGAYQPHRATHCVYVYGAHYVGDADGKVCELDASANTNNGDPLVRDRISPHAALPSFDSLKFPLFELDLTSGEAGNTPDPQVSMRYSDDGGATWSAWMDRDIGAVGEYNTRVRWTRLGAGRDRVWHVRCTDDTPFAVLAANVETA